MNISKIIIIIAVLLLGILSIIIFVDFEDDPVVDEELEVKLYFSDREAMYLVPETRTIDGDKIYIKTVQELIKGPQSGNLSPTIPEGVEVIDLTVENGLSTVNFNQKLIDNHWGGSSGEIMTVYSIVNTLIQFDEIDKVRIIIAGEEVETLVGHMDLSQPLEADFELINE